MTDKEILLDEVNRRMRDSMIAHLGITITGISPTTVEATMPVDARTCQPMGILHGGASLTLAETMAGLGSLMLIGKDETAVGMEVTGNHVSSAPVGTMLHAESSLIHKGRSTHLWNTNIYTPENKLVSTVRVLNCIVRKKDCSAASEESAT